MYLNMSRALRIDDVQSSLRLATSGHVKAAPISKLVWIDFQLRPRLPAMGLLTDARNRVVALSLNHATYCQSLDPTLYSVATGIIVAMIRVHGEAGSLALSVEFRNPGRIWCSPRSLLLSSQIGPSLAVRIVGTSQEICFACTAFDFDRLPRFASSFCKCSYNL